MRSVSALRLSTILATSLALAPMSVRAAAPAKETAAAPAKPDAKVPAKATTAKPAKAAPAAATPPKPGELVTLRREMKGTTRGLSVAMEAKHFVLANGLRVYVLEDHSTPSFSFQMVYNVGSRDDEPGRTGFAHFFEHMMFKGSANIPDGGHFQNVLGVGGKLNAFTSQDVTLYFDILPSQYLDMVLWLESDRLRSLAITDENFENQRKAVKEEKAMRVDNVPYSNAIQDFFADAWKGTGYGHPGIGSEEDLSAATTADVKAFFDKYYVPNNAVMVLVGDVDAAEVQTKVEKHFGDIARGPDRQPFAPVDHTQVKVEKRFEDKLAQQPLYVIGWKTVPATHPDRHAVELLMNILMRGDSSRITKQLVDEKKLAVAAIAMPSEASGGRDAGAAMAAFVPVEGKSLVDIETVVKAEIDAVKKKGITRKDLQKAINQMTADTIKQLSTNNGRGILLCFGALLEGDPFFVLSDTEKYRSVTPADIKRVANTYLTDNWMVAEIVPAK
ncbi:MAG: insulinase family protein [Deltaproteobacteria bacterium]|nr:insulinase family protein [Deltaproteobacteria bacterium]